VFQACIVLQKRHLPDQPLEYLLKWRTWSNFKSGYRYKYFERWIAVDNLCNKFAVGPVLIKLFEESKVGQLAVDTYLSKRRSLPSPVLSTEKEIDPTVSTADERHKHDNVQSVGKAVKRKSSDLNGQYTLCNCIGSTSSESLKTTGNSVVNSNSSPLSASGATSHKLSAFYGNTTQPVSPHKHFPKRLLLSDKVPRRDWSKNSAKGLKLPNLEHCKPEHRKLVVIKSEHDDSDSDADVRYSLATDRSDASSDSGDSDLDKKLSDGSEKRHRKQAFVNGVTKSKKITVDTKRPKVDVDREIKFKTSNPSVVHNNYKAGIGNRT